MSVCGCTLLCGTWEAASARTARKALGEMGRCCGRREGSNARGWDGGMVGTEGLVLALCCGGWKGYMALEVFERVAVVVGPGHCAESGCGGAAGR